jgi:hypothetical protein
VVVQEVFSVCWAARLGSLQCASGYSEDIDLVVVGDRPEGHIRRALNRVLSGVLGTPKQSVWGDLKLAIRNTVKPSRVLRMTYAIPSLMEPGTNLEIVVEANVTERTPHQRVRLFRSAD